MNTVIYYPYISPRPDWLKVAALCWDKVFRIVPPHGQYDSSDVEHLNVRLGSILESVDIREVGHLAEQPFLRWVDARKDRLKDDRMSYEETKEREAFDSLMLPSKFSMLSHVNLVNELDKRGLVRRERRATEPFIVPNIPVFSSQTRMSEEELRERGFLMDYEIVIYLPKDVALHYLSLCASQAALDGKRDLVADGMNFTDAVFHDYSVRGEIGTAVLQAYLPENFSDLEPERIRDFREEFSTQRLKYQTAVQEIVDQYKNTASEGTLESVKRQIEELAKEEVNETTKTYRRANQKMVLKTLGMSLTPPAIATFIGSALGIGIFAPAGIVAAASVFGAGLLIDHEEAKSERYKSPWSYVLDAAKL